MQLTSYPAKITTNPIFVTNHKTYLSLITKEKLSMSVQKIARRDSGYAVVSIVPDFCFVPGVVPPVPFPLSTNLGSAQKTAKKVRLNGKPAFVHDASAAPRTFGDQPGVRKGVISRTVGAKAWSKQHSSSVRIHKHKIVRTGDFFHMNGKFSKRLNQNVCLSCKAALALGRPVNPIHGLKFLTGETDFAFGGILPLVWQRSYYSDQEGTGWLGQGWSVPFCQRMLRSAEGFLYIDEQGRVFPLPDLPVAGEPVFYESEQIWFSRDEAGHCFIASLDGSLTLRFAPLAAGADEPTEEVSGEWPLVALEDASGNHQRVLYHRLTGLPEYVIDGNGRVFYLLFADAAADAAAPLLRLHAIYLLDALPAFDADVSGLLQGRPPLVRYAYDAGGDLIGVYDEGGMVVRSFAYRDHMMVSHTDAAGLVSAYEYDRYDLDGKVLRNHTSLGEEWRFAYHDGYTVVTDVLGRSEQYHYDENNELVRHVKADGSETLMERDHLGRLLSLTDELGRTTRYQYSAEGQVTAVFRPDGSREQFDYDDTYRLVSRTDAEGHIRHYAYDAAGRLASHTDALKHTTRFAYLDNGLLAQLTAPNGSTTRYTYNAHNLPESVTDCSGHTTVFDYTDLGQLAGITDAAGHSTRYRYDERHRLSHTVYPDGGSEHFTYDAAGRLTAHTDADGNRTEYGYAADGLPEWRTNALGGSFRYRYDAARRLVALTNENSAQYRFAYDVRDRLAAECAFDGKTTVYTYNPAGELLAQTEYGVLAPEYQEALLQHGADSLHDLVPQRLGEFERDLSGRLTRSRVHDGSSGQCAEKAYAYDTVGRLIRAAQANHVAGFDYDGNGRLIGQYTRTVHTANRQDGLPPDVWDQPELDDLYLNATRNLLYYYDPNGNPVRLELPDRRTIGRLYYGSGHLHHINFDGHTLSDIERDVLHREIQRSQGTLTSRYTLDPLGRLLAQQAQAEAAPAPENREAAKAAVAAGYAVNRSYGYGKTGNLARSSDLRTGTTQFSYDRLGRIQSAQNSQTGQDEHFAFDPAHNLLPDTSAGRTALPDNRIREYSGIRYFYDDLGNLIHSDDGEGRILRDFAYDLYDRLIKAEVRRRNPGTGEWDKEVWHYEYDALDRRVAKWREAEPREGTDGLEAGTLQAEQETDSGYLKNADGLKQVGRVEFVWDGSHLLQEIHADRTYTYVYTDAGSYEPLAQITDYQDQNRAQEILYYHCDQIGVPRELSDQDGHIVWTGYPDAWGYLKNETQAREGIHQPLRLQNQYCDEETGLHYNFFRYYDPVVGRFVSQDPIGLMGASNFYFFAPNTKSWIDISGLAPDDDIDEYGDWYGYTRHTLERNRQISSYGAMKPCPKRPPENNPLWKPYSGDSSVFHCGYRGYMEANIIPSFTRKMNECFYDENGILVDENHKYSKCGGTPDAYDSSAGILDKFLHGTIDPGGVAFEGLPAYRESQRHKRENSK